MRQPKDAGQDRYAPRATDSAAVAAWRQRMASAEAQAIYQDRAATAECVNALARNRGLRQLVGAWLGQGEGDRAVVCDRAQPAAGGESARGAGDARLGGRMRKVKAGPAESAKGI